jgi:hypothetical protein
MSKQINEYGLALCAVSALSCLFVFYLFVWLDVFWAGSVMLSSAKAMT